MYSYESQKDNKTDNKTGMSRRLKHGLESLTGQDLSNVRVHRNSLKPRKLNALAYAQGNNIHLAPGQEKHLPHEAWHVIQQKQGRVPVTRQLKGIGVNDDSTLEREADVMGAKALNYSGGSSPSPESTQGETSQEDVVQRQEAGDLYRGGVEMEKRETGARIIFENIADDETKSDMEEALKGLAFSEHRPNLANLTGLNWLQEKIMQGLFAISFPGVSSGQTLNGPHWDLTVELNNNHIENQSLSIELELIFGGPKGSTVNELINSTDNALASLAALDKPGTLHFGSDVGTELWAAHKSRMKKIHKAKMKIPEEDPDDLELGEVPDDWKNIKMTVDWTNQSDKITDLKWGSQITLGIPLDKIETVGAGLEAHGLKDTSKPDLSGGNFVSVEELLSKTNKFWKNDGPNAQENQAILVGLSRVLSAYIRGRNNEGIKGPKHTMGFVNKHPLNKIIKLAAQEIGINYERLKQACLDVMSIRAHADDKYRWDRSVSETASVAQWLLLPENQEKYNPGTTEAETQAWFRSNRYVQGDYYEWKAMYILTFGRWKKMLLQGVDLVSAFDGAYRSGQIGGLEKLNDAGYSDVPVFEYRDLGEMTISTAKEVLTDIKDRLNNE